MTDETKKPTKKPGGWSAARRHLTALDKPALLALVKDLYDSSAENRDFIQARCQAADSGGEVLETYRKRIIEQFFSKRADGMDALNLGVARKAILDYRKATGNLSGTAELDFDLAGAAIAGHERDPAGAVLIVVHKHPFGKPGRHGGRRSRAGLGLSDDADQPAPQRSRPVAKPGPDAAESR